MRLLRLGLGTAIVVQSVMAHEIVMVIVGLLFTGMAVFNIGCCGMGACSTPVQRRQAPAKDIEYEEVV